MLFSPKIKILLYLILVLVVFVLDSQAVSFALLIIVLAAAAKVPLSSFKRGFFPIALFLFFTFISNVLFQEGRIVYEIFGLGITDEGLNRGGKLTLRLFILITGAKVLTASTRSEDLVSGMTALLGPLGKAGFVQEFFYIVSLTLRLLPVIYDEAIVLYKNVRDSSGSGFAGRIRLSVELLTTLFERSMVKAREMDVNSSSVSGSGEREG